MWVVALLLAFVIIGLCSSERSRRRDQSAVLGVVALVVGYQALTKHLL